MFHFSKLTSVLLPFPLKLLSSRLSLATFPSFPTLSSLFLPSSWLVPCDVPCFQVHQPGPPPSPPVSESSDTPCFQAHQPTPPPSPLASESLSVMCHVSRLTNPPLPLPPLQ